MNVKPQRLLITLKLGEMPEQIPSLAACRRYHVHAAERIDGGVIDRVIRHFAGAARSVRLHHSRVAAAARPGISGARRFDDVEQLCGVARVLRVDLQDPHRIEPLCHALAQIPTIESVRSDHLYFTSFENLNLTSTMAEADHHSLSMQVYDEEQAWETRQLVGLPQALGFEPGDPATIVGLADTGVDSDHAEIGQQLRHGFDTVDLTQELVGQIQLVGDYSTRDEFPNDDVGHGTACAGILGANASRLPPGGIGGCGLVPARVLGAGVSNGKRFGVGALSNIDAGMVRLINIGVKVINMSFGTAQSALSPDDPLPHQEVIDYAIARGVILVAASGNSASHERYYPAAHDGVIAVAAVDNRGVPCDFSSYGEHVTIAAPGKQIWSTGLQGYRTVTGTSFAAPFVTSICALMAAYAARRALPINPEMVKEILRQSARPFARAGVEGFGAGILDGDGAMRLLASRLADNEYLATQSWRSEIVP